MKKYIDDLEVQKFEEVNNKIIDWKNKVLEEINSTHKFWKKWLSIAMALTGLIIFIIALSILLSDIFYLDSNKNPSFMSNYIILIVVGVTLFFVASLFWLWYKSDLKKIIKSSITNFEINPFVNWFNEINENIIVNHDAKLYMKASKVKDYSKLKYRPSGVNSIGLDKEYELSEGTIFNNPYELSCGIWHSVTKTDDSIINHYDYLPLLKIKTNLFPNQIISITNSAIYGNFLKKDVQLEDDEFNRIFSVNSSDENAIRMLLTPVVQNKWKEIRNLPQFNMRIENGFINILFKSNTKFMDIDALSKLSAKKFRGSEEIIWKDINILLSILTLAFSISIFQFEEVIE